MLSRSVLDALHLERARLLAQVQAIDALLAEDEGRPQEPQSTVIVRKDAATNGSAASGPASYSLRALFRRVLAAAPRGMTVTELAKAVEDAGFRPTGKTSTRVLLYGDLHRLRKQGRVVKSGGRYSLPPERVQHEASGGRQ